MSTTHDSSNDEMTRPPAVERDTSAVAASREVVRYAPLNTEAPNSALATPITATAHSYIRSNFETPQLDSGAHRIVLAGAIRGRGFLSMGDLAQLPQRTVVSTMECAGNDRTGIRPLPAGEPWKGGAISTTRWTGVSLHRALETFEVNGKSVEVLATGADSGTPSDATESVSFARAIPMHVALSPDTLLALRMNDEPLPARHGGPVRLVVPGWYGMASVKWVSQIELLTGEYGGYFQKQRYVYEDQDGIRPVTRMRVKSLIAGPGDGSFVRAGDMSVWGWAWSGEGKISAVEVSASGDGPWYAASLMSPESSHAWRRWEASVPLLVPGRHVLRSRARDSSGAIQPDSPLWNRLGYGNNAIAQVTVNVEG
ncbi:MAG TPA: molybdopterin-dependent oxidoreductase [Gemmatimonadaceae bacterium]|nr:molybdopterin-dependent oxidoreductase [Gemmatimonadaceae bacterium]